MRKEDFCGLNHFLPYNESEWVRMSPEYGRSLASGRRTAGHHVSVHESASWNPLQMRWPKKSSLLLRSPKSTVLLLGHPPHPENVAFATNLGGQHSKESQSFTHRCSYHTISPAGCLWLCTVMESSATAGGCCRKACIMVVWFDFWRREKLQLVWTLIEKIKLRRKSW